MALLLILIGSTILLWGILNVFRPLPTVVLTVTAGLMTTGIGIQLALGKARVESDKPTVLISRRNCYRYKVKSIVNMTCHETAEKAREAMYASPEYKRWKALQPNQGNHAHKPRESIRSN